MNEEQAVTLTREQLYDEIWTLSVAGVAKKYNADYNELRALCKEVDIPIPPSGYWAKLKFGKPAEKLLLPESSVTEVELPMIGKPKRTRRADTPKSEEDEIARSPVVSAEEMDPADGTEDTSDNTDAESSPWLYGGNSRYNVYYREKLYKEIWAEPVVKVAERYGVSDVAIHKVCRKLDIPTPPLGYWARVKAGAKLTKTPLPKSNGPSQMHGAKSFEGVKEKVPSAEKDFLKLLPEEDQQQILVAAQEIAMPPEEAPIHKKIAAYRTVVKNWNKTDRKDTGAKKAKDYYYNPPFLAGLISEESLPRVYRILDALFRQVERLGGLVEDDLSLQIQNEHVRLEIVEGQNAVPHVITRAEAQALMKYQDEKRHDRFWASKPQIRKNDYVFNGRLRISVRTGRYFRDTDKVNVESRLGDILIEIYEEAEKLRLERLAREEEARRKAEEARQREERRNRYNEEVERTVALENAALDFETACRIRAYVKEVQKLQGREGLDDKTAKWIEWATKKADWLDPTIARDDELFGKREHEKAQEEKVLKKHGQYW